MLPSQPETNKRLASIPNPFSRDVVGSPLDEAKADVPRVNVHAKRECAKLIEHVRSQRESRTLLLFGEPGSGKTHLLSRLRDYLDRENEAGKPTIFVPLRMQTSASMMWRFVRNNLADALLRRLPGGRTTLERMLEGREDRIDSIFHRDLAVVLENLLKGIHVRDSATWLRGYELPETALVALGLSTQPLDEEFQEERAFQVIKEIAQIAEPMPVVFCLDQVESLQRHPDDKEGIFALGKLVATLHDVLRNAAIICCVQTAFIVQIQSAIRGSEQDRLLRNQAGLKSLTWEQALDVIAARLETQPELADARPAGAPRLWPIDPERLKKLFEVDGTCVARSLLHRAKVIFDEVAQGVKPAVEPLDTFLGRMLDSRSRPRSAQESDFIIRDALPQVFQVLGMQPSGTGIGRSGSGFDLVVEHNGRPAAFALCNQRPGVGLVSRFRKLGEKWDSGLTPRLVLLRDSRLGIGANAKGSQQKLDDLRGRRAEMVNVSPEALSALDAIRSLLADADSGDLAHNGETVPRKSVEDWIASNLPSPLADLLDQLKGQSAGSSRLVPALTAFLQERKIVSMEEAARELNVDLREVSDCANQNPEHFAVLGGRSPVLFHPVRRVLAS